MSVAKITIQGTIGTPDERLDDLLEGTGVGEYFSASTLRSFIEDEAKDATEIEITIDSPGGDVVEGFEMYDLLRAQTKPVTTIAKRADSIASVIFLAGTVRKVVRGASFVIHNAWISPADLDPSVMLNAQTLERIKQINEDTDSQIMAVYMEKAGRSAGGMLREFMEKERSLSAEELKAFNFATEVIAGQPSNRLRAVAYNKEVLNIKIDTMSEDRITALEKGINKVMNWLKGSVKAMTVQVADGPELYVFSEDGELPGKKAVIAEGGEPTDQPAPEGTHPLSDGREIVVGADGIVQEVREAEAEGMTEEEMNAAIEEEKAKIAAAMEEEKEKALNDQKAEYEEKMNDLRAEFTKQMEALQNEVKALKNEVPGDEGKETPEAPDFKKMTRSERILAVRAMNRKRNQ